MFWGVTLETGKRYAQVVSDSFHVSMAALEPQAHSAGSKVHDGKPFVSVMVEREKSEFLLCTLQQGKLLQQPLDLNFEEGESLTFFLNGEGVVHLTGFLVESEPYDEDIDEDDEELSDEEVDREELAAKVEKRKAIEDKSITAKKQKLNAEKIITLPDSDEDDDDDDDDSEIGNEEEDESDESSDALNDSYKELIEKRKSEKFERQDQKKTPGKTPAGKGKTPQKNATPQGKFQKNEVKQVTSNKDKQSKENIKPSPKTPTVNGDQSGNQLSSERKKRKRRSKSKSEQLLPDGRSPAATPVSKTPSPDKKKSQKLSGGTIVEDLHVGNGPMAKPGKMVQLYYVGKLSDNSEFDKCTKGEAPFKFRLGQNEVIKGWDVGIKGMKVGGRRKIVVPPHQGYGPKRTGKIPPNSTLHFDVELIAVD